METPNSARGWFLEKLVLIRLRHHCDVTAIFSQNDDIFAMTSLAVQILHIALFFNAES